MKKLFTLFSIMLVLWSCSDNDETDTILNITPQTLSFSYQSRSQNFSIEATTDWVAVSNAKWVKLSSSSGINSATITVTVDKNESGEERSAIIKIKDAMSKEKTIAIKQSGIPETAALYILSEGNWGKAQAELSYYDISTGTISKKYFAKQNNGDILGDTGNDLAIYGSKMYCVVSGAEPSVGGYIQMIDPKSGIATKKIEILGSDGKKEMPRKIAFLKNKAYITTYSGGVACLDTASLTIDSHIKLSGTYPEGICVYNNKLYICNSGQGTGNTISVVNTTPFKEDKAITVPKNPVAITATTDGDIYFTTATLSWSTGEPSNLYLLDAKTEQVVKTFDIRASRLALGEDYLYTVDNSTDWSTFESVDYNYKIDLKTKTSSIFTKELWDVFMAYNINVNPANGDVYMGGQGQDVAIFDKEGTLKTKLKTGTGFTNSIAPLFR